MISVYIVEASNDWAFCAARSGPNKSSTGIRPIEFFTGTPMASCVDEFGFGFSDGSPIPMFAFTWTSGLVFAEEQIPLIEKFTSPEDEIFPIKTSQSQQYYALNTCRLEEVVDEEASEWRYSGTGLKLWPTVWAFERGANLPYPQFFRLKQSHSGLYFAQSDEQQDSFIDNYRREGWTGLEFRELKQLDNKVENHN